MSLMIMSVLNEYYSFIMTLYSFYVFFLRATSLMPLIKPTDSTPYYSILWALQRRTAPLLLVRHFLRIKQRRTVFRFYSGFASCIKNMSSLRLNRSQLIKLADSTLLTASFGQKYLIFCVVGTLIRTLRVTVRKTD